MSYIICKTNHSCRTMFVIRYNNKSFFDEVNTETGHGRLSTEHKALRMEHGAWVVGHGTLNIQQQHVEWVVRH